MTARFNNAEVRANPDRSITASFEVLNLTGDAWRPSAGFAVGYHIFDPATDTLVVDGPRTPPGGDIAPGEACKFELRCELPAETGRYRVFVSGMQEHSHWLYERGAVTRRALWNALVLPVAAVACVAIGGQWIVRTWSGTVPGGIFAAAYATVFTLAYVAILRLTSARPLGELVSYCPGADHLRRLLVLEA